jgi:hypothetical protein
MIEELKALAEKATPGPWETDTLKSEGEYGTGPDTTAGFEVTAIYSAKGEVLFDPFNSDAIVVQEDYGDEDGYVLAWDQTSAANAALIVALVNNLPAILSALAAVPVMKEALEAVQPYILDYCLQCNGDKCRLPTCASCYGWDTAEAAEKSAQIAKGKLNQALAALEPKP